ncbi:universal stress protein [Flaviaesturariibacter flavus]|uniref:Universal stress protein n=1 Tax=Flaviaesturariibacter flavus TaxID=2502780 RepID=A0A4R1BNG1_9BACT|nr:universal stress protein [Flaviaesturariibacter flavus]TCJ19074.1 universal stress protein [Flaviaesturariibacter flavus]
MKKFIAAFDGLRFSASALSYAIELAKNANAHLVGVFLEDPHLHSYGLAEIQHYKDESFEGHLRTLNKKDDDKRQASVHSFRSTCEAAGIAYSVHRDRNAPIRELLHESIYADLLIVRATEDFATRPPEAPSSFVRELLQDVQCPVVLVPEYYHAIMGVKLLYDGSPASVCALRSFSHLFENLRQEETEVITVKGGTANMHIPDGRLIREFAKRHFPHAEITVLNGYADEGIIRYLRLQKKEVLLVLGAHRRSALSRLFHPSMTYELLHHLKMPLFVANHG